jgi:hypothetical protein
MSFEERMNEIQELLNARQNEMAKIKLEEIIKIENYTSPEDEEVTHYSFENYAEAIIYFHKYNPVKKI